MWEFQLLTFFLAAESYCDFNQRTLVSEAKNSTNLTKTTTSACPMFLGTHSFHRKKSSFQTPFWAQRAKRSLENSDVSPKHFFFCSTTFNFLLFWENISQNTFTFNLKTFKTIQKLKSPLLSPKVGWNSKKTHQFKGAAIFDTEEPELLLPVAPPHLVGFEPTPRRPCLLSTRPHP